MSPQEMHFLCNVFPVLSKHPLACHCALNDIELEKFRTKVIGYEHDSTTTLGGTRAGGRPEKP